MHLYSHMNVCIYVLSMCARVNMYDGVCTITHDTCMMQLCALAMREHIYAHPMLATQLIMHALVSCIRVRSYVRYVM